MADRAETGPDGPTLVLFCRRPVAGVGKQRLAGALGAARTAEVAGLLLDCALEDVLAWPGPVVIAPARASDAGWAAGLLKRDTIVLPQPEGNLGERLNAVDRQLRAAGHQRIAFIGSDAPLLDADFYAAARAALGEASALLALARDGGVTLMGASAPWPDLSALPWSTPALADALATCLAQAGTPVRKMAGGYDVDRPADLLALAADLAGDPRPARQRLRARLPALQDPQPGISIIIPVLHDEAALAPLLAALAALDAELIVVDGAGSARCAALCQDHQAICVQTAPGRGGQLAAGAARASGEILWFLHADAEPPAGALPLIRATLADPAISGGYFRFRFQGEVTWYKRLLAALVNWRTRFGVPYGDQGLFMRRSAYLAAGGFASTAPLFEEVPLLRALRRQGRVVPAAASIGVASRRWERDGWLWRSLANRGLALAYMLGASPAWLARRYRPLNERKDE